MLRTMLLYHEEGGSRFFRNVGTYILNYMTSNHCKLLSQEKVASSDFNDTLSSAKFFMVSGMQDRRCTANLNGMIRQ